MLAASLVNLLATATITASSAQAGYPVSFLAADGTPDIPWKTTATGDQWALINHGSAKSLVVAAALYANFTSIRLQANATDVWTSPTYNELLTIGENPGNGDAFGNPRYCRWRIPDAALVYQYNRWFIPSQATTDGAAYYRLGAIFAGAIPYPSLRNLRWDYDPTPTQATELVPTVGGAERESILGPQYMRITGTRNAFTRVKTDGSSTAALLNDGVAEWMAFERQWKAAGKALIIPAADHPYWVGMMRLHSVSRRVGIPVDDASFEWREVA